MFRFVCLTLAPALCLAPALVLGGLWSLLSVFAMTVLVFLGDRILPKTDQTGAAWDGVPLGVGLALVHFGLWAGGLWALGGATGLTLAEKAALAVALGLYFGQISNSNAHELIHARPRFARHLGLAVYISLLFGHHKSAHLLVHHVQAGTRNDPNTARLGEGFWRYLLRAGAGEFRAGWLAETRRRSRRADLPPPWTHPYVVYLSGAVLAVALAAMLGGWRGIIWLFVLASYAQIQLYLSDYVQHYGLERLIRPDGTPEPMGPQHSWNAPHLLSGAMMLNAPLHSDHHANPGRSFPELRLDQAAMPMLPQSLPVMAVIALIPPLWRRLMDPRAHMWRQPDPLPMAAE